MRILRALGLVLLVAGVITTVLGVLTSDIQVGLALFFIPYLQSSTWAGGLAILLIFAGILVLILDGFYAINGQIFQSEDGRKSSTDSSKTEMGGVVLIGPIPIVFGSSNRAALLALIAAAVFIMALLLALFFI
jgi:uncharacterized protein (TIGR00304 family)